ncbi:hypothetical protein MW887_003441 [Aspergillus wentii]|nr:hypothetical protein MW887_003441 [Aspergillus wentii]
MLRERVSKTCTKCKSRKVRCIRSRESNSKCVNCLKRGDDCDFRLSKRKFLDSESPPASRSLSHERVEPNEHSQSVLSLDEPSAVSYNGTGYENPDQYSLYVDELIEDHRATGRTHHLHPFFKAHECYIGSASVGYFSESRIQALANRLGHNGVETLLERIFLVVEGRYERHSQDRPGPGTGQLWEKPGGSPVISETTKRLYLDSYFSQIHPVYPFLDRRVFEERALSTNLPSALLADTSWSALYHAVIALGCQYHGGGAFEPGKGESAKFFQVALGSFPEIVVGPKTLESIQAITAMAILSLNFSYMHIDGLLITEAARIAQRMRLNSASNYADQNTRYRVFWVIYTLEKAFSFNQGSSSVIMDSDIGCPIPTVPESIFGDFNWLLASVGLARLLSRAYQTLFSITATWNTEASYYAKIDNMNDLLERWRQSIPLVFRPGEPFRAQSFHSSCETYIALRTHFFYYDARIALCRLTLHLGRNDDGPRQVSCKKVIMQTSRSIIELLRYIDMEPYTPVFILAHLPLSALFILFDLVIHNPTHNETSSNLALLEVVGGHFSRLEYSTGGSVPSSILSEFAYIARTFVRNYRSGQHRQNTVPDSMGSMVSNDTLQNHQNILNTNIPMLQNQVSGQPPIIAAQDHTSLFLPTFDTMPTDDGSFTGFNVTDLFGGVVPSNQDFFFEPA